MGSWRDNAQPAQGEKGPIRAPLLQYGAPNTVRLAVNSARPRDKLATLQQFYPDAEPTPDGGNFLYTDESGQKTLYNKSGLDVGDIVGFTRPAMETAGAIGGAALAAPTLNPLAIAGAAGLGGVGGGAMTDVILSALGQPQAAGPVEKVQDVTGDLLTNLTAEGGGMVAQNLLGRAGRALASPEAAAVGRAATRLGIRPSVGMVGAPPVSSVENAIAHVFPGSRAAREQVRAFNEVAGAARGVVPGVPGTVSLQEAGATLKTGVKHGYDKFRRVRQQLDDRVYNLMPADTLVPTTELAGVAQRLQEDIARAPEVLRPELGPVLQQINETLASAQRHGGALPLQTQRNIRTLRREQLNLKATTELTPGAQRWLRDADTAMRTDLRTAAKGQNPEAFRALDRHDRLVVAFRGETLGRESIADSLDAILKANSDEAAYSALMSSSGGANRMQQVLGRLSDPERRVVARATWDNMLTTPQGNFNLNRLVGQWNKASPAARKALFGRVVDTDEIDDLMTVIGGMREADRSRNFSNTAYTLLQASLGEKVIGEMGTKIAGISGGASALGSGLIPIESLTYLTVPYIFSEIAHNRGVARALADAASGRPVRMTETVRRAMGRAAGRALSADELGEDEDQPVQPIPTLPESFRPWPVIGVPG